MINSNNEEYKYLEEISENYQNYSTTNLKDLTNHQSLLLSIHTSSDSKNIQKKLWKKAKLSENELKFVSNLKTTISEIQKANSTLLYRHEINLSEIEIKSLKLKLTNLYKKSGFFKNLGFWNFSEDKWEENKNELIIEIKTAKKSNASKVYLHYGEDGEFEKEIIFPPNTKFKVTHIEENYISLIEIEKTVKLRNKS